MRSLNLASNLMSHRVLTGSKITNLKVLMTVNPTTTNRDTVLVQFREMS